MDSNLLYSCGSAPSGGLDLIQHLPDQADSDCHSIEEAARGCCAIFSTALLHPDLLHRVHLFHCLQHQRGGKSTITNGYSAYLECLSFGTPTLVSECSLSSDVTNFSSVILKGFCSVMPRGIVVLQLPFLAAD